MLLKSRLTTDKAILFLGFVLMAVVFAVSHFPRLGSDEINPDAINWHNRSEQYVDAIKSWDFERTYQHYHPGVTLMFIMGFPVEVAKRIVGAGYDKSTYELYHTVAKYSLNFVLLILTLLSTVLVSKIYGYRVALVSGLLLTIEPFFLGNARILHMDVLLSLLVYCSLLMVYLAYQKNSLKFLVLGSFFLGLSFWTKNVALLPIVFSLCFLVGLAVIKKTSISFSVKGVALIVLNFFLVGLLTLPALWVNPYRVFSKMIGGSKTVVDEGHEQKFFGAKTDDPGPLFYPLVFAFKLSPQTLIGFVVSTVLLLVYLFKDRKKLFTSERLPLYYLLLFFVCFLFALTISNKKIDRYVLPLFPIILLMISYFSVIFLRNQRKLITGTALVAAMLLYSHPLISYFPYYFVYNSPMLGGNVAAENTIGQKSFGIAIFEVRDFILKNYGDVKVGFVDRKPIAAIYPNSKVFDARVFGPHNYDILVLDSDEVPPNKTKGKFVYDKSIKIGGINYWNFYVKAPENSVQ